VISSILHMTIWALSIPTASAATETIERSSPSIRTVQVFGVHSTTYGKDHLSVLCSRDLEHRFSLENCLSLACSYRLQVAIAVPTPCGWNTGFSRLQMRDLRQMLKFPAKLLGTWESIAKGCCFSAGLQVNNLGRWCYGRNL